MLKPSKVLSHRAGQRCLWKFGGRHLFLQHSIIFRFRSFGNIAIVLVFTGQRSRALGSRNLRKAWCKSRERTDSLFQVRGDLTSCEPHECIELDSVNRIDRVQAFILFLAFSQIFALCLKNISLLLVYVVKTVNFWHTEGVLPYLAGCDVWKVEMDQHVGLPSSRTI